MSPARPPAPAAPEPPAQIWLPREGQVLARFPPSRSNRGWLHHTVGIRSPQLIRPDWHLPCSCLTRLLIAAIDRYGYVAVYRDMARLTRCNRSCLEAQGVECNCTCMGLRHGEEDSGGWYEGIAEPVVEDLGEFTRSMVVYGPRGADGDARIYRGELTGTRYRVDRSGRLSWPLATAFMCAACATARAQVWDHCHSHGYVRAPLCSPCNTRHWRGWRPEYGRAPRSRNVDTTYYRWCPRRGDEWEVHPCSS